MAKLMVTPSSHRSVRVYCIQIYIYPCYKVPTVQFWHYSQFRQWMQMYIYHILSITVHCTATLQSIVTDSEWEK